MYRFINAIGFQTAWWVCIAGVAHGFEIAALLFCAALACGHLRCTAHAQQELRLAAWALGMGIVVDSLLQYMGVMHFHGLSVLGLSPLWLWMLWVMFAFTLNTSLAFLKTKPLALSALAGLIFGPLTYYAGAELGAASWVDSTFPFLTLALAWMVALPSLVFLSRQ